MTKTVVGLFDHLPDAQAVAQELRHTGVVLDAVSLVSSTVYSGTNAELQELLVTAGASPRMAQGYVAEVARGGTLVLVETDAKAVPDVVASMQRHHVVDMKHRLHRVSKSRHVQATAPPRRARATRRTSPTPTGTMRGRATVYPALTAAHEELAVPIVEEELRIGTRQVNTGGIRVETHVEAIPVAQQVTVRTEQVRVERRTVDRVVGTGELPPMQDSAIEVRTTAEDVVVEKQARIVEEVVIRKEAEEHIETITDTVRRTAVQVEELPSTPHTPSV